MEFRKKTMEELERMDLEEAKEATKYPYVLVLDNIRSMNNVGSAFRTGDAFNCQEIILVGITAKPPHREIAKTALGADESVTWKYFNTNIEAIQYLNSKKFQIISVEQTHNSISLEKFIIEENQSYAFVFGNEVFGVNDEFLEASEKVIEIPQFGVKHSINVSVSIGVISWDFVSKLLK
ncbi:MAG: hypothetical protein RIR51_1470 [Bacteroidota bacterium]|jgi:tRNA G18 (ribose-2'-O)-methylase SpoU